MFRAAYIPTCLRVMRKPGTYVSLGSIFKVQRVNEIIKNLSILVYLGEY